MKDKRLEHIEQCLQTHDPVGLIKMGAPLDEYDGEALLVFERTNRYYSIEKVQRTVYDVFVERFSGGDIYQTVDGEFKKTGEEKPSEKSAEKLIGSLESYREIAEQIVKILNPA